MDRKLARWPSDLAGSTLFQHFCTWGWARYLYFRLVPVVELAESGKTGVSNKNRLTFGCLNLHSFWGLNLQVCWTILDLITGMWSPTHLWSSYQNEKMHRAFVHQYIQSSRCWQKGDIEKSWCLWILLEKMGQCDEEKNNLWCQEYAPFSAACV